MQGESGMQENNREKLVVQKRNSYDFIKKSVSPASLWFYTLFILFLWYFPFKDLDDKKNVDWFIDSISKITGKSSIPIGVQIHGDVDATVSMPFKNAAQACWYYHANYENSHAYTVLWDKSELVKVDPEILVKIRVIAEPAYWQAERCTKEDGQVKLIGIEYTKHSIEARLEEKKEKAQGKKDKGFVKIASSEAYYRSALFFDKDGRITERKVLENQEKKDRKEGGNFEYESSPGRLCVAVKQATNNRNVECPNPKKENTSQSLEERPDPDENEKYTFKSLKKRSDNFNVLKISSDFEPFKDSLNSKDYRQAIMLYIKEREKLHSELVTKGCGAISIEPELTEDTGNFFQTSIAFLCLKKSGKQSHVRLMHRVSEQKF